MHKTRSIREGVWVGLKCVGPTRVYNMGGKLIPEIHDSVYKKVFVGVKMGIMFRKFEIVSCDIRPFQ